MLALLDACRDGSLAPRRWRRDLLAGAIVGVVALPLSMAFAIASGARPEQGIYTAIVAGLLVSIAGGSRVQIAGPTGAFVAILAGVTARYGIAGLQLATLMAGAMLLLMGLARLGGVIKFIPAPVVVGFTAGIAVIIFVGQWQHFLGLPKVEGAHFHEQLLHLLALLPRTHPATLAVGSFALVLSLVAPRLPGVSRIPGPLVAMVGATALHSATGWAGVATIGSAFGGIPRGLPAFAWPAFGLADVITLLGPAFTIAMLGAIESLLSAVVADGMTGKRHDSNQELVGQGLANLAAPLFGGFAATGAIARTATNVRQGGTSPLAGIAHAATLVAIVCVLAPLAEHIPLAALAAILFVVAWNMCDLGHFWHVLRRAPRADSAILVVTFALTVFADLVVAVNVGVVLAVLQFLRRMSETVDVVPVRPTDLQSELEAEGVDGLPPGVLVYEIDGPFFFGAVEKLERALGQTHSDPRALVLRLRNVPFIDMTGLLTLGEAIEQLRRRGVRVLLCEANERVRRKLGNAGILGRLEPVDAGVGLAAAVRRAGDGGSAPTPVATPSAGA